MRKSLQSMLAVTLALGTLATVCGTAQAQLANFDEEYYVLSPEEIRAAFKDAAGKTLQAASDCFNAAYYWDGVAKRRPQLAKAAQRAARWYRDAGNQFMGSRSMLEGARKAYDADDLDACHNLTQSAKTLATGADKCLTNAYFSAPYIDYYDWRADESGERAIIAILRLGAAIIQPTELGAAIIEPME